MRGDLTLICDTEAYGPTRNLPSTFRYVGPLMWHHAGSAAWLADVPSQAPLAYVTLGSTGNTELFARAVDVLLGDGFAVVASTAGIASRPAKHPRLWCFDFVPALAVLARADLLVCQGGNGTIYQAMSAAVPLIGVPTMIDQEYNMERAVALGFGIELSEQDFTPAALLAAARVLLKDPRYKEGAARSAKDVARYGGASTGVEEIERFMSA